MSESEWQTRKKRIDPKLDALGWSRVTPLSRKAPLAAIFNLGESVRVAPCYTVRMQAFWDQQARKYDRAMRLLGGPMPAMAARVAAAVRGQYVLEVGAGTGLVTTAIARSAAHVVATDYAAEMVKVLQSRAQRERLGNVTCMQADLYALPLAAMAAATAPAPAPAPARFEAVVAANVLHLVPDLPAALTALAAALRPGGALIAPTYCHDQTLRAKAVSRLMALGKFPGRRRFTLATLCAALTAHGFQVVDATLLPGTIPIGYVTAKSPH